LGVQLNCWMSNLQENTQIIYKRARTSLRVDPQLLEEFQSRVREVFGKLKGTQELALNDAIKLWLELSHGAGGAGSIFFGFVETAKFRGYRALNADELAAMIKDIDEASMVALNGSVHSAVVKALLALNPDRIILHESDGKTSPINQSGGLPLEEELGRKTTRGTVYLLWDMLKAVAELDANSLKILKKTTNYELASKLLSS
jgi:hypothetical protein